MSYAAGDEPHNGRQTDENGEAETRRSHREELRSGFCWKCFFAAFLPLIALLFLGWFAASYALTGSQSADQIAGLSEQLEDLDSTNQSLKAQLDAREKELSEARTALLGGQADTPDALIAKISALPDGARDRVLAAFAAGSDASDGFDLSTALDEAEATDQAALFGQLPSFDGFGEWFGGLSNEEKSAWIERLPGDVVLSSPGVDATDSAPSSEALIADIQQLEAREAAKFFAALPSLDAFTSWFAQADDAQAAALLQAAPNIESIPLRPADYSEGPHSLAEADRLLQDLEAQLGAAEAEVSAALAARSEAKAEIESLRATLSASAGDADATQKALAEQLESAQTQIAEIEAEREEARAALSEANAKLAAALTAQEEFAAKEAELTAQLTLANDKLVDANEKLALALTAEEAAAADEAEMEEALQLAEAKLAETAAQLEAARSGSAELTASETDLAAKLTAAEEKLRDGAAELAEAEEALAVERKASERLSAERDEAVEAAAAMAGGRIAALSAASEEIDALKTQLAEAQDALAQAEADRESFKARISQISDSAADDAKAALAALKQRTERLETELADANAKVAAAQAAADEAERRIAAAEARSESSTPTPSADIQPQRIDALKGRVAAGLKDVGAPEAAGRLSLSSNVAFASGKAELSDEGKEVLDRMAKTLLDDLSANPDSPWLLLIEGHTDRQPISTETFPSNWELSTARAAAVARYLTERGVPGERIVAAGRAAFEPIDPAKSAEAYRLNRRIEFDLIKP